MGFLLVVMSVLSGVYGYIGWRLIVPLGLPAPWNVLCWLVLIFFLVLPPLPILLRVVGNEAAYVDALSWIAYVSLGFFLMVFVLLVFRDVGWLSTAALQKIAGVLTSAGGSVHVPDPAPDPGRRQFLLNLTNAGVTTVAAGLTTYGIYEARRRQDIVEVDVPLDNLPEAFNGFRIVQITDIHAGPTVKRDYVAGVVEQVNALNPDLVAFTGDLADGSVRSLKQDVAPLGQLDAPFGTYFVTGNHEYYSGVESWVQEMRDLGFDVLINEHRLLEKNGDHILLGGVTDYTGGQFSRDHRSDPASSLKNAPECPVRILLAHQPRSVFEAAKAGYHLQISGHTHGGQFFPWNFFVLLEQPFVSGLHRFKDLWVYVSKGTGYWGPPLRVGAKSEITVLKLGRSGATA